MADHYEDGRLVKDLQEHNRQGYLKGCRCKVCSKCQSDYRKANRQKNKRAKLAALPTNTAVQAGTPDVQPGSDADSVYASVQREIDGLAGADDKPGQVATALAMAKLLDNPVAISQHPSAAARLMEVMASLSRGGRKKQGKLALVKGMTAG